MNFLNHVAIIMDGNGRWGLENKSSRNAGHKAGLETVEKIILTASGGPFRDWPISKIRNATVEEALAHPNWDMGARISIDSASMFNKALEVIEAKYLFNMPMENIEVLNPGEIGVFTASIKQVRDTRVGDTITLDRDRCSNPLTGYKPSTPVVFCGLFPVDSSEYQKLKDGLAKLQLNDARISFE